MMSIQIVKNANGIMLFLVGNEVDKACTKILGSIKRNESIQCNGVFLTKSEVAELEKKVKEQQRLLLKQPHAL